MATLLQYPDVSYYDRAIQIQPGTQVVVARCTLSDSYADPWYLEFQHEAHNVGAFFMAYHWLNHGNIASQVGWALAHTGTTPLMLDCEDVIGNTGYNGPLSVDDITSFVDMYSARGGVVHLNYIPHWYWQGNMGSPDLTPLVQRKQHLVASDYATHADTYWPSAYGHMNVDDWQFTDAYPYGDGSVDMNRFPGTVQDFITLATGGTMALSDRDATYLINRVASFADLSDTYTDDLGAVHQDKLVQAIKTIQAAVTAPQTVAVTLSDADRTAIASLVAQDILAGINLVQKSA